MSSKKYTKKQMAILKQCYGSPLNEHNNLSFKKWLKAIEKFNYVCDMLGDE